VRLLNKYSQVAKITWKTMMAYQADAWLGALVSGFRVLLAFLLWKAIFAGRDEVAGYTFPAMITYSLAASILSRLQHQDALAWQLAEEVRNGQFSRYLTYPLSVTWYFICAGLGRWSYMLLVNGAALAGWGLVFSNWIALNPNPIDLAWLAVLLPLGALVMLLLNHAIALLSLKFVDVTGFMVGKGSVIELISGSLIPLSLLPAPLVAALRYTPFYYVIYYPANLLLGRVDEPPILAVAVLLAWSVVFFFIGQTWFRFARRQYEGVGI